MNSWHHDPEPLYDTLQWIPESERVTASSGEEAATLFADEHWVVPNGMAATILYAAVVDGFDYQIEFFCREVVHHRTVFLNKIEGQYVTVAWCDEPPGDWDNEVWPSMKRKPENRK